MLQLLRSPDRLLGVVLALLVGITLHSIAQAAVARALGDRMPAATGRLRPDPRRHFDPFGIIVMVLSGIGWNKPVALQEPRFRGARRRYVLAVLAGPLTNLALGALGLVALYAAGARLMLTVYLDGPLLRYTFAQTLLYEFAVVNAAVGILTLVPLPPLDGARILWLYTPKSGGWQNARYQLEERNIGIGLCVLLMLPIFGGEGLLMRVVESVSGAFLAPIATSLGMLIGF